MLVPVLSLITAISMAAETKPVAQFQRLKLKNDFTRPEQVVEYFVRRDFQGSFTDGMGETERKEFTLWRSSTRHELFLVAKEFKIEPAKAGPIKNYVEVAVTYDIADYQDGAGTSVPVQPGPLRRVFALQRDDLKRWRILIPTPKQAVPVLGPRAAGAH